MAVVCYYCPDDGSTSEAVKSQVLGGPGGGDDMGDQQKEEKEDGQVEIDRAGQNGGTHLSDGEKY